jgi:hypothetical protein
MPVGALQPRVEPEIGLRLGRPLPVPCSADDVLAACDEPGHSIGASFGDGHWLAEVRRAGLRSFYRTGEEDS